MLKVTYKLSPNANQLAQTFIALPWDFKILYGILADTCKLPFMTTGSKRGYLVIFAFIEFLALFTCGYFKITESQTLIWLLFTASLCNAFLDSLIDGITCIQQRKDPVSGA